METERQVPDAEHKLARADAIRRRMWGDDHAQRVALLRRLEPELADVVMREFFGGIYADDRLTLEQRSLCTITSLATLGHHRQLASHMEAALRLGVPASTLSAVLAHTSLYAGLPPVLEALRVLDDIVSAQESETRSSADHEREVRE